MAPGGDGAVGWGHGADSSGGSGVGQGCWSPSHPVGMLVPISPLPPGSQSAECCSSFGEGIIQRGFVVPGPLPSTGKDVGGFRARKLFSYHLKTGMKSFSKASLQAMMTSREIPASLCLARASHLEGVGSGVGGRPCPSRAGLLTVPAATEINSSRPTFACTAADHIFGASVAAQPAPAQILGLCSKHLFGEDFVRVQKEVLCLLLQSAV